MQFYLLTKLITLPTQCNQLGEITVYDCPYEAVDWRSLPSIAFTTDSIDLHQGK